MAIFKVDVQKERFGLYWTNRYLLERDEPGLTPAEVDVFAVSEKAFHATTVNFISLRISDMVEGTDNFSVYPLTGTGIQTASSEVLPGFDCVRVDIPVGFGRPCRKYYRTYVDESYTTGGNWSATYQDIVSDAVGNLQLSITGLVDPQGNAWQTPVVKSAIQMRQLRRGSKRKITPVIPVA